MSFGATGSMNLRDAGVERTAAAVHFGDGEALGAEAL